MKKITVLILFVMVFTINYSVNAVEFNSGISYNNLVYTYYQAGERKQSYFMQEDLNWGLGYYGEVIFWPDNNFGVGIGFNNIVATWQQKYDYSGSRGRGFKYNNYFVGPYFKMIYQTKSNLRFYNSIAYYNYRENFKTKNSQNEKDFEQSLIKGEGPGFIVGAEYKHSLNNDLALLTNYAYRYCKVDITEKYSWYRDDFISFNSNDYLKVKGLMFKFAISYNF